MAGWEPPIGSEKTKHADLLDEGFADEPMNAGET
eukprot:CAMPEP_0175446412 /NCGR_PEP_ID=MMETSP0095-20121207/60263_1 /TAXON_ID=311494 /ORGANISM="Alexandrium monilatum, Strain CCMP3105" /LENGTH=33 /DNA_ID= /DNA_START= /DNA_END= /DNA_ORIENTATION=